MTERVVVVRLVCEGKDWCGTESAVYISSYRWCAHLGNRSI